MTGVRSMGILYGIGVGGQAHGALFLRKEEMCFKMKLTYRHTKYASYIGYITQAIINNLMPLLFVSFERSFGLSLDKISAYGWYPDIHPPRHSGIFADSTEAHPHCSAAASPYGK